MSARPSPGPSARPRPPPPPVGIAAGAEDAKYQTKYRELKRKVRDIETDNDKLHFKVLQAKRTVQRMKLERAILYERLAPPVPALNPRVSPAYPARTPADMPPPLPIPTRPPQPYIPQGPPSRHDDPPRLSSFMPRLSPPPDSRRVRPHPAPPHEYDYPFDHPRTRTRHPAYYHPAYAPRSPSASPVSGSGSAVGGDISRPDSRHYYEPHERDARAFKLRPVNPHDEMDFVHEDGRSRDRGGGFQVSRKRARNEMDVDDDALDYASARVLDDRGKRYRELCPSIDAQDDARIGPP